MDRPSTTIIGISAPAGGGKSTLMKALAARLENAVTIEFDDYADENTYPADFAQWIENGADFNAWDCSRLALDLADLRAGQPATRGPQEIPPARYIVFEAPLGYAHRATGQFIDFAIFVDTPLEVALARFLHRNLSWFEKQAESQPVETQLEAYKGYLAKLKGFAQAYTTAYRFAYLEQHKQVLPLADLVVNGEESVEHLTAQVMHAIKERVL